MKLHTLILFILLAFAGCNSVQVVTPTEYNDQGFPTVWVPVESLKDD